jgi:hypothetical protein
VSIKSAREIMRELYESYPSAAKSDLIDRWLRDASPDERTATLRYGADRLYGEVERNRSGRARLRVGERTITSDGEQLSMPLLEMGFAQAEQTVERQLAHAAGAVAEARFADRIVAIAKERCRERGLDPYDVEIIVGQFIDTDEIGDLRAAL